MILQYISKLFQNYITNNLSETSHFGRYRQPCFGFEIWIKHGKRKLLALGSVLWWAWCNMISSIRHDALKPALGEWNTSILSLIYIRKYMKIPRAHWLKCSILTASPPTQPKCPLVLRVSLGACLQLTIDKNKAERNIKTKSTTLDQIMAHTAYTTLTCCFSKVCLFWKVVMFGNLINQVNFLVPPNSNGLCPGTVPYTKRAPESQLLLRSSNLLPKKSRHITI